MLAQATKMETETAEFNVLEWNIENFSCWNLEKITSQSFAYPISESNRTGYIDVKFSIEIVSTQDDSDPLIIGRLYKSSSFAFSGDISFIASDGFELLPLQQFVSNEKKTVVKIPGPSLKEMVARIRKNEGVHRDSLTVRCRIRSHGKTMTLYNQTKIEVFNAFFKMSSETLKRAIGTEIYRFNYPDGTGEIEEMVVKCSKDQIDPSKISIKLQPVSVPKGTVLVFTRLSLVSSEGQVTSTEDNEHIFRDGKDWHFCNCIWCEDASADGLSLNFQFKITPPHSPMRSVHAQSSQNIDHMPATLKPGPRNPAEATSRSSPAPHEADDSVTVLTKELMCLYQNQDHSDFVLKCENVSIPVHKNILSARSPVFKSMISCDMQEATSGSMDIGDMDPSTLARFLAFLYTGGVEGLQSESALNLYYAADKYQVPTLKKECVDYLSGNVSFAHVCDILSLGNQHQDHQLIAVAYKFILKNFNQVLSSEEWKKFKKSEPELAVDTVTFFAEKNCIKSVDS